jgi:hypothetical protein
MSYCLLISLIIFAQTTTHCAKKPSAPCIQKSTAKKRKVHSERTVAAQNTNNNAQNNINSTNEMDITSDLITEHFLRELTQEDEKADAARDIEQTIYNMAVNSKKEFNLGIFKSIFNMQQRINPDRIQNKKGRTALMYLMDSFIHSPKSNDTIVIEDKNVLQEDFPPLLQAMQLLLMAGANPNHRDSDGVTPLLLAAQRPSERHIKMLLLYGADIKARDNQGNSILDLAKKKEDWFVAYLMKVGAPFDYNDVFLFTLAASAGEQELVEQFVKNGMNINAEDRFGQTALQKAIVTSENIPMVETLLRLGADINHSNQGGNILWLTTSNGEEQISVPMLEFLICAGADVNYQDPEEKRTVLMNFIEDIINVDGFYNEEDLSIISTLLRGRPNLSLRDHEGRALVDHLATNRNDSPAIQEFKNAVKALIISCSSLPSLQSAQEQCKKISQQKDEAHAA